MEAILYVIIYRVVTGGIKVDVGDCIGFYNAKFKEERRI